MRTFTKYCIGAFILLLALACNRESRPEAILDGTGSLVLNIGSSTKAETAADGDKMNNLHVWVTDKSDVVVRYACWTGSDNNLVTMDASHAAAKVSISNINRGEYNIYIVANAPSSFTIPAEGKTIGDTFKKYVMTLPVGEKKPDFGTGGMPLTLISSVAISPGKNVLNAELVRVCGRIRVSVRNHTTSKNIFLQSVKLGALNPDRGYLFQQDGHAVPDKNTYGEFVSINNAEGAPVSSYIKPGIMETVIDQYIFETGLNAVANMSLSFSGGIFGDTVKEAVVQASQMDVYTHGAEFAGFYKNNIKSADYFIIRNSGANYFLRSNGSGMKQYYFNTVDELLASNEVERYFWTFDVSSYIGDSSGIGPSYVNGIQSVSEKKYINISTTDNDALVTLSDKQQPLIIGTQKPGMLIRNGDYKIYCSYTTGDDVKSKINDADQNLVYWKMIPVTKTQENVLTFKDAEKDFHKNVSSIDYIDDFGVSVPLTDICRNEDVNVIINVFYNPEYASVYFEVSGWEKISNETTFD
ncbi:MAG: fimbrial protein [Candidatus Cryptobacteroides sp.]|nr:fimbrial protein [Bacteroidales bacterium]MDY6159112.1 fimbrial protein [Candidatus Cryptobacteroides sp.]